MLAYRPEFDRFRSSEKVNWNQGAYDDGFEAHSVYQAPITAAPSAELIGEWCRRSWVAGWCDADMADLAGGSQKPGTGAK